MMISVHILILTVQIVIDLGLILFILSYLWSAHCLDKAANQRLTIFSRAKSWGDYLRYDEVPLSEHQWMLMTFRDPLKLYGLGRDALRS